MSKKPDLVIGFGSFATLPMIIAAIMTRTNFIIHEQNTLMGRANRICAKFAKHIIYGLPPLDSDNFYTTNPQNTKYPIAMPLRQEFIKYQNRQYKQNTLSGISNKQHINIVVLGGSQGASIFSDFVPSIIARITPETRQNMSLNVQCPQHLLTKTQQKYDKLGVKTTIKPFFDGVEIANVLASADVVIARAGAATITEIKFMQKPAILVPYPHAMDNHQYYNALVLENIKTAVIVEESSIIEDKINWLELANLIKSKEKLAKMSGNYCKFQQKSTLNGTQLMLNIVKQYL